MKTALCYISLFVFVVRLQAQKTDFASIDFKKADSIALSYKNEQLTNIPELSQKLTDGLSTDTERFRAIYMWICQNIANDYALYFRNMGKRYKYRNDSLKLKEWNDKFRNISIKKLLKNRRTICTGYAYLLQQFSEQLGIPCEIIHGYARTSTIDVEKLTSPNHSWNAVYLNNKWYLCDPTWAAGIPDPDTNLFTFTYNDGFFLANPELFAINHFPVDTQWLLLPEKNITFNDFLEVPVLYGSTYNTLNSYSSPKKMHHNFIKNEALEYRFETLQPVAAKQIRLSIDNGSDTRDVYPENILQSGTHVSFSYAFEHKGFYDVHLYINDRLISTHTVRVK